MSRAGSPTRRACQPRTPVTAPSDAEERVRAERSVDHGRGELPERGLLRRGLPAAQQRGGNQSGGGRAVHERDRRTQGVDRAVRGQSRVDDEAGGKRVDGGDRLADGRRVLDGERRQRDLGAVDEFVDHGAGAVDRDLAGERRDRERETGAHAGAEGAQGDHVGGLLRLGALAARDADGPVPAVAAGEQGGVEVVRRASRTPAIRRHPDRPRPTSRAPLE